MASKPYPTDVVKQAQEVLSAWEEISPTLTLGDLTSEAMSTELASATTLEIDMAKLEALLTDKRNQRDALYTSMWNKVKRVRNGMKAIYGDNSSQYEMVGGTRLSERKSPTRKPAAP